MKYKLSFFIYAFILLVLACIFFRILTLKVPTDIQLHALQVTNLTKGLNSVPPNFLYYIVVWIFSGFSSDIEFIKLISALVLALAIVLKFGITQHILLSYLAQTTHKTLTNKQLHLVLLLSVFLLIIFTIPDAWYYRSAPQSLYLGRLVPNVWHNSTVIFLFPFALLLFWEQYCILFFGKKINAWKLGLLIFVNIAIKPSFFFIFASVVPFFSLYYFKFSKSFWLNNSAIIVGGILLLLQTYLIFVLNLGTLADTPSHLAISAPFEVWKMFMPEKYIPNGLLNTFGLPLAFLVLFAKELYQKPRLTLFVVSLGIAAVLWFGFIAEAGERQIHGNFFWQCVIASYLIFMAVIMEGLRLWFNTETTHRWRFIILLLLLIVHIGAGINYIDHILKTKVYL